MTKLAGMSKPELLKTAKGMDWQDNFNIADLYEEISQKILEMPADL